MAGSEDAMAQQSYDECNIHGIVKGRRTKRHRSNRLPSPAATTASSNSSAEASDGITEEEEEEEEEDLANCLILLAQGRGLEGSGRKDEKIGGERPMEESTGGNLGNYVYRCRTCSKCFSSFQALGGHRTSHKRPKSLVPPPAMSAMESKKAADREYGLKISVASYPDAGRSGDAVATTVGGGGGKSRSHECSICGLEFSSGQALGGHMRRHRTTVAPTFSTQEAKKEKNAFDLDLNLPAPQDDEEPESTSSSSSATNFPFAGKQPLHLPALVGCHY